MLLLLLLPLLQAPPAPPAAGVTPLLSARLAEEAATLAPRLHAELAKPKLDVGAVEGLMSRVEEIADAYFHAPNLKAASIRPHALALRLIVNGWIGGARPVLALSHDVLHFRPEIHRRLAAAHLKAGRLEDARRHLAEVLAVTETRADLEAWDALEIKLGRPSRRAAGYTPRP